MGLSQESLNLPLNHLHKAQLGLGQLELGLPPKTQAHVFKCSLCSQSKCFTPLALVCKPNKAAVSTGSNGLCLSLLEFLLISEN